MSDSQNKKSYHKTKMYLRVETMMKYFLSDFGVEGNFSNIIP